MSVASIDNELKALDKKIKLAELKKLEEQQRTNWISPATIGILLPLVGAFGLWTINELKGYNRAYQALVAVDQLQQERAELISQKDSLNIEISTLLDLKLHYSQEANRLETLVRDGQLTLDQLYLRASYAANESIYALQHANFSRNDNVDAAISALGNSIQELEPELSVPIQEILLEYRILNDMSSVTKRQLLELLDQLKELSPSQAAEELSWHPEGAFASGRSIMATTGSDDLLYYDVELGRYLTDAEAASLRE